MGNVKIPKARYLARDILNAEALLEFDGVNDWVETGVSIGATDSYSFISDEAGTLNHYVVAGSTIYVNGLIATPTINAVTLNAGVLEIGRNGATYFAGVIGLVRKFNKLLSAVEVAQLVKFPFAPPASLHQSIVAPELIPKRSYFKDAANLYGKGANSILWFDSSEQYEYTNQRFIDWIGSYGTNFQLQILELGSITSSDYSVNIVGDELVIEILSGTYNNVDFFVLSWRDNNTSILGRYLQYEFSLDSGNTGSVFIREVENGSFITDDEYDTAGSTISVEKELNGTNSRVDMQFKRNTSVGDIVRIKKVFISSQVPKIANHAVLNGFTDAEVVTFPEPTAVKDFYAKTNTLNWTNDGGDTEIASGLPPIRKGFNCNSSNRLNGIINNFGDNIGLQERSMLIDISFNDVREDGTDFIFGLSGQSILALGTTTNGGDFRMRTDGPNPGNESIIIPNLDNLVIPIKSYYRHRSLETYSQWAGLEKIEDVSASNPLIEDATGQQLRLVNRTLLSGDYFISRAAIFTRELTELELYNTIIKGDNIKDLSSCECYYLFNDSDAFVEGTDLKLRDYSGNNRHITINGLSGATAADRLITYQNQLVDIDELR